MRDSVAWEPYRKRPVLIRAIQYSRATRAEIIRITQARHSGIDEDGAAYETAHLFIPTLEGDHMASLGDWIVQGIKGEFYPVKPDIFEATYVHAPGAEE